MSPVRAGCMFLNNSSKQGFHLAFPLFIQTIRKLHFRGIDRGTPIHIFALWHKIHIYIIVSYAFKGATKIKSGLKFVR
jgi:hypothetical protein